MTLTFAEFKRRIEAVVLPPGHPPPTSTPTHCIDGEPWCRFGAGTVLCLNGDGCENPNHRGRS